MCTVRFLLSKTSSQPMFDFVVVVVVVVVVFFPTPLKGDCPGRYIVFS